MHVIQEFAGQVGPVVIATRVQPQEQDIGIPAG